MARPRAEAFTSTFESDKKYALGENHWPISRSWSQNQVGQWKSQTVRNYLFTTIDHKAAVVLDATPSIHVEPLDDDVTFQQRQEIGSAVKHELERLRWDEITQDVFLDGAVTGTGLVMCRTEPDKLTQQHKIRIDVVDPRRFYPDPSASRLNECRFVVYEPELDMSVIKSIFPEKGDKVKPSGTVSIGKADVTSETRSRSNDEIVYGPGTEVVFGQDGLMRSRKANVCFIWIRDDALSSDTVTNTTSPAMQVSVCPECGVKMEQEPGAEPDDLCDHCGYQGEMPLEDQPAIETQDTIISRAYPFGRMIAMSGDVLLYDGPNPYEIETVFPFAVYTHYRVSRRFWGYGDVALLKSPQMVADKNMAQLLDAMRLTANGPFEYPAEAEGYTNLGNSPGQLVPVPLPFMGKAHYVTPNGYNVQLHSVADEANIRDFQRVSGVSDVSIGTSPSAPTSGVEVQARQRAAATRVGKHLRALNTFRSDLASLVWKVMNQYYIGPRAFMAQTPTSEYEAIVLDVSKLPKGVAVRVDADLDAGEKDKLMGQNIAGFITSGGLENPALLPYLDIILSTFGAPPSLVKELQTRVQMQQMMMQQQAMLGLPPPVSNVANGSAAPPPPSSDAGQADGSIPYERMMQ